VAGSKITGADIARGTITGNNVKNGTLNADKLTPSARTFLHGHKGPRGLAGKNGKNGATGLKGAYYSVAKYDVGDTNGGAIATVACASQTDVAVSGGVQTLALGTNGIEHNVPVSSSFPGRMDWNTNTPKAGRLDGWIVQFGTEVGNAPKYVDVYALCVPNLHVTEKTTYTESGS
jgi:hypothetical protein